MTIAQGLVALVLASMFVAQGVDAQSFDTKFPTMRGDLKHLKCPVCRSLVGALHNHVSELPKKANKKGEKRPSENDVAKVVEEVCRPDKPAGAWIAYMDVAEQDGTLTLAQQSVEGTCRSECRTIHSSCNAVLDEVDADDLAVALWKGKSLKQLEDSMCREWSNACSPKRLQALDPPVDRADEVFTDKMGNEGGGPTSGAAFTGADAASPMGIVERVLLSIGGDIGKWAASMYGELSQQARKYLTGKRLAAEGARVQAFYLGLWKGASQKGLAATYKKYERQAQGLASQVAKYARTCNARNWLHADRSGMVFSAFVLALLAGVEALTALGATAFARAVPEGGALDELAGMAILLGANVAVACMFALMFTQ